MARTLAVAVAAVVCAVLFAPAALADNAGFAPPDSASSSAKTIKDLYWMLLGITGAIFLIVEAALLVFIFRFRRRRAAPAEAEGPQIHGNTRLELIWIGIPVLILIAIIVATLVKVPAVEANPKAGEATVAVDVTGYQYYWQYQYENGVIAVTSLRLPVDRTASLRLASEDVAHSWWVPALAGKRDAIPGRVNELNFKPNRPGVFKGQCAEFCGILHAVMRTEVEVVPQEEFDRWLEDELSAQEAGTSGLGRQSYVGACSGCHGLAGEGDLGPQLAGNANALNKTTLLDLLANGQNTGQFKTFMPAVGRGWSDRQVDALIAYIETLEPPPEGN